MWWRGCWFWLKPEQASCAGERLANAGSVRRALQDDDDDVDAILIQRKKVAEVRNEAKWRSSEIRTQVGVGKMWGG